MVREATVPIFLKKSPLPLGERVRVRVMKSRFLKSVSRKLRQNQTDVERKLWSLLRSKRFLGIKFRRQLPVGPYIVDFCSLDDKLIIELDGGQHNESRKEDDSRTKFLESEGFRVIRVWNNEALANLDSVLEYIRTQIRKSPSPQPSPLEGEGEINETNT